MTACGKTYYILKMLEEEYANHFDYMFIVCPTFEDNKTYQNWEYLKTPTESVFRDIVKLEKNTNSLVILDDCAASKDVKKQNQRTRQTCFQRETYRSEYDSHHPTTNFHREAVQDEHIKTHNLLQLPQGRLKGHVREPPGCQQVRATKNFRCLEKQKICAV